MEQSTPYATLVNALQKAFEEGVEITEVLEIVQNLKGWDALSHAITVHAEMDV